MTRSGLQDRAAAIDTLLSVARRETLVLAIAVGAMDDDAAAVASARLRWAIGSARQLITTSGPDQFREPHARQLDRVANRAQRWLFTEPPESLHEISCLVDRVAARRGGCAAAIDAEHASLVDLDLDELDLGRIALHGASLIDVTARHAGCDAADARSTRWLRCELEGSSLAMAVFSASTVEHCELSHANLEGTSWHRATLSHSALRRTRLVDARLDRAVFSDCNLRGADLGIVRSPNVATLAGARFVRCDLRETNWAGRELGGASFIDCKLFGAHGAPALAGVVIERPDVSLVADGSQIGTQRDVVAGWRTMVGAASANARV
jgi:Pentapeptide repeats (9 copies)